MKQYCQMLTVIETKRMCGRKGISILQISVTERSYSFFKAHLKPTHHPGLTKGKTFFFL